MTTIATDGRSMAADSLVTSGGERVGFTVKVQKTRDGTVFGSCGPSVDCSLFADWMHGDIEKPELSDDFSALVLEPDGQLRYFCKKLHPVEFVVPQAIGSGADFAIGAMLAGMTPEEAVAIAMERDTCSGGMVHSEHLDEQLSAAA